MKLRNKKGFTLAELLIVLAILAVLIAIAIPAYSAQLESSRVKVDAANLRAAESMASASYLLQEKSGVVYYAVAEQGANTHELKLISTTVDGVDTPTAYIADGTNTALQNVTAAVASTGFTGVSTAYKTKKLVVKVETGGVPTGAWI